MKNWCRLVGFFLLLGLLSLEHVHAQTVDFTSSNPTGCTPLTVNYQAQISGATPTAYKWTFGNGNTSTTANPSATYVRVQSFTVTLEVTFNNGVIRSTTKTNYVTVFPSPAPTFVGNVTSGCSPLTVNFSSAGSQANGGRIVSYLWNFGDGGSSTAANPSYTYRSAGVYNVSLLIENENGCRGSFTRQQYIRIGNVPTPDFTAIPTQSCSNRTVSFTNGVADNSNYTYLWSFGDGQTSTSRNPAHTYARSGIFDVSLRVTDTRNGCIKTTTKNDFIKLLDFVPNFETQADCDNPLKVRFTNTSEIISFTQQAEWDFDGDGRADLTGIASNPAILNPTFTYTQAGNYTPKLKITDYDASACSGERSKSVRVDASYNTDRFAADRTIFRCVPATVKFRSLIRGEGYTWRFGDGSVVVSQTDTVSYTYNSFGVFDVSVTIRTSTGCEITFQKDNYIRIAEPTLEMDASILGGCFPLFKTTLIDETVWDNPNVFRTWKVFNQNGNLVVERTSQNKNTAIEITEIGVFDVELTLQDPTLPNCIFTKRFNQRLRVGLKPLSIGFSADPLILCNLERAEITNTSQLDPANPYPTTFYWDFDYAAPDFIIGDSSIYTPPMPYTPSSFNTLAPYQNVDPKLLDIGLIIASNGCRDTLIIRDLINLQPPKAFFSATTAPCVPNQLILTNRSVRAQRIEWTYGNGQTSTENSLVLDFPPGSLQTIRLQAWNDDSKNGQGCSDIYTETIRMPYPQPPIWNFSVTPTQGCTPIAVNLRANMPPSVVSYRWTSGDGRISNARNASFTYNEGGRYTIGLRVTVDDGCRFDTTVVVDLFGNKPVFVGSPERACAPANVTFNDITQSNSAIVKRIWDFGDGTIDSTNAARIIHRYENPPAQVGASYTVKLTLEDENGCITTTSQAYFVSAPKAEFTFSRQPQCEGDSIVFSAIVNQNTGLFPLRYQWVFNGGRSPRDTTARAVAFFRPRVGHTARLVITDANGCSTDTTVSFDVFERTLPEVEFDAKPGFASCPPLTATFVNRTNIGSFPLKEFLWDFGDGTSSTLDSVVKIYENPGKYTVTLTVVDEANCQIALTKKDFIIVSGPVDRFEVNPKEGYPPLRVEYKTFAPVSEGYDYKWDFGDGNVSAFSGNKKPSYTYTRAGIYIPAMTLRDTLDCEWAPPRIDTIRVLPCPILKPQQDVLNCRGLETILLNAFDESHVGTPVRYQWYRYQNDGTWQAIVGATRPTYAIPEPLEAKFKIELSVVDKGEKKCVQEEIISVAIIQPDITPALSGIVNRCNDEGNLILNAANSKHNPLYTTYEWIVLDESNQEIMRSREPSMIANRFAGQQKATKTTYIVKTFDIRLPSCNDSDTVEVTFFEKPKLKLPDLMLACGSPATIDFPSQNGEVYTLIIEEDTLKGTSFELTQSGKYTVLVENLCGKDEQEVTIEIIDFDFESMFVPNVFSPNNDNLNETFEIPDLPPYTKIRIYDRWGKEVYRSDNYQNDWRANKLENAVYYYVITHECMNDGSKKGWLKIVR